MSPWQIVHQQTQRWLTAGVFKAITADLRMPLCLVAGRDEQPTERKGAKVHLAVDTLGHLLVAHVSATNENKRAHVGQLLAAVQEATGENVQAAFADQGYTGEEVAAAAAMQGVVPEVVWPARDLGGAALCGLCHAYAHPHPPGPNPWHAVT